MKDGQSQHQSAQAAQPENDPVLHAERIGKAYSTTVSGSRSRRSRDVFNAILQRPSDLADEPADTFWAVRKVSLDLRPGESLGVIGRNGAGKTTTMKMLSGLLPPDEGSLSIKGEVQAMVNLSGGIDKTLSGLQNITNACALRGYTNRQSLAIRDDIIAFAELEDSIDRLVSTYSSGMKARLGFAICVHMTPSLIVIDEALAVGDTRFKQKCLRKLNELRSTGVAMILVSHSMGQIRQFCDRVIWLEAGAVRGDGSAEEVISQYQAFLDSLDADEQAEDTRDFAKAKTRRRIENGSIPERLDQLQPGRRYLKNLGPFGAIILDRSWLDFLDAEIESDLSIKPLATLRIPLVFRLLKNVSRLNVGIRIYSDAGLEMAGASSLADLGMIEAPTAEYRMSFDFLSLPLAPGRYHIVVSVNDGREKLYRSRVAQFRILNEGPSALNTPIVVNSTVELWTE